jgi:GTP-binding protein
VKITDIKLVKTVYDNKFLEDRRKKIVFAGRSNVGKSTLINTMFNRKNLAKVSSTPGKTRSVNYYLVNDKFYFVDLPGYGYAKVPKTEKDRWKKLLNEFFYFEKYVILLSLIVDSKIGITDYDKQMVSMAAFFELPTIIIGNKIDKLKKNEINKKIKEIDEYFNIPIIPFSAKKGIGKNILWETIQNALKE